MAHILRVIHSPLYIQSIPTVVKLVLIGVPFATNGLLYLLIGCFGYCPNYRYRRFIKSKAQTSWNIAVIRWFSSM